MIRIAFRTGAREIPTTCASGNVPPKVEYELTDRDSDRVQINLSNADKAADATTFGAFAVKLWTSDAVTAWGQLVTFCTNMQTALLNTTVTMMQTPQAA